MRDRKNPVHYPWILRRLSFLGEEKKYQRENEVITRQKIPRLLVYIAILIASATFRTL